MPEPKKQSSPRKTGLRRSHLRLLVQLTLYLQLKLLKQQRKPQILRLKLLKQNQPKKQKPLKNLNNL